jgi:hypothetical protein
MQSSPDEFFEELKSIAPKVYPEYPRCGIWIPDGWKKLVKDLSVKLNQYCIDGSVDDFKVTQIKEKFFGLRFYTSRPVDPNIDKLISEAEEKSYKLCTVCGEHGDRYCDSSGRYHVLCKIHIDELGNKE